MSLISSNALRLHSTQSRGERKLLTSKYVRFLTTKRKHHDRDAEGHVVIQATHSILVCPSPSISLPYFLLVPHSLENGFNRRVNWLGRILLLLTILGEHLTYNYIHCRTKSNVFDEIALPQLRRRIGRKQVETLTQTCYGKPSGHI